MMQRFGLFCLPPHLFFFSAFLTDKGELSNAVKKMQVG